MLEKSDFNADGIKVLCEMNGKNADMHMNIYVKKLKAGETYSLCDADNETAVMLTDGTVEFCWNGETRVGSRLNPFEKKPFALHTCRGTAFSVKAESESQIIIEQTNNEKIFEPVFYSPDDILYQEFGKGQWNGAGHRVVSTVFDYDNAPYSNLVLGEVFNKPGCWSSYPPHHHPQPEVYYYRFNPSQGFGACFNGDVAYKSTDGSACYILPGDDHQQVTAPGYEMYYVWMIRHIDGDPWYKTTRISSPEHEWLLNPATYGKKD